jgi:6-pyruvoyltetrahydropterin/6-carboxytetrahydropterin synthase
MNTKEQQSSGGSDPRSSGAWGSQFEISQTFFFDAAHTLRRDIEAEGSRRIHGHTYNAEVTLSGQIDPATGMVLDLGLVRQAIDRLRPKLDHHFLDEVPGLGPATLENLAAFIWRFIAQELPTLVQVRVWRQGVGDSCTLR